MYDKLSAVDTFMVLGIHNLIQLTTLNPVFIDISNSPPYTSFADKYPRKSLCTGSGRPALQYQRAWRIWTQIYWSRVQV